MARQNEYSFAVVTGDWDWNTHNTLGEDHFFQFEEDALSDAGATITGERFVCADGQIALTPVDIEGEKGYLVEDLREVVK
jgi:hypothetical protein